MSSPRVMTSDADTRREVGLGHAPRIHALSHVLSNQIAAGEVIERPASVVKELLENSLDAGARRIDIEIESAGVSLVCVRDDGTGIHGDDLELALRAHATSKVYSLADLERIESLGFRGEALPSIAAVSRLELSSRTRDSDSGWEIRSDGGVLGKKRPAAGPPGTVVSMRDLFFNTPARRRFLRTERTELRHIEDVVRRVALSRFDVAFSFQHNQREIFRLPALDERQDRGRRVQRLCGRSFSESAAFVDIEGPGMWLCGWLGAPAEARGNTELQYFFINGRPIRDSTARHAIRLAYDNRIASGRHPAYVLYLSVDPSAVDVNVHPAKQEVRFREARLVHDFLWRNLARGLDERLPDLARSSGEPRGMTVADAGTDATGVADPSAGYQPTHEGGLGAMLGGTQALATAGRVAVIGRRYALDIDDHGVVLVDLVCARRILVARALAVAPDSAPLPSRPLLLPLPVECSEQQADRVEALNESLGQLGFELRRIAPGTLTAHAVPAALAHVPVGHLIAVILRWSGEGSRPAAAVLCESLATIAGECLDDLLSSGESMKSFLRALDRHAAELAKIRARLRLDAGALEALLRRWSG